MNKLSLSILTLAACTSPGSDDLDSYLGSLSHLPTDPSEKVVGAESAPMPGPNIVCTTQPHHETRQHDEVVAFAANSASMWPGSLLRGDSVYTGTFTPLALARASMTFSLSLENLAGSRSATLDSPSLSSYREAIADILAQSVTGATPANLSVEIAKIDSEEQIGLALGAGGSWNGLVEIKASFNWASTSKKSRYLVKFVQTYYTVDVDPPSRPSAVFDPAVSLEDVQAVTSSTNPPVYVSSVTYGRMVVFTFESDGSNDDLEAAVNAVYQGPGAAGGMVSVKDQNTLAQSRISAYILGGAGGEAVKAIDGIDALLGFIKSGGDYSQASPGAPIAYKLAHLSDNETARLSFTDDYEVKQCTPTSGSIRIRLESIQLDGDSGELDGTIEIYGIVTVSALGSPGAILMQKPRAQAVTIGEDETWPATNFISEQTITVDTTAGGGSLTVFANLVDADVNTDDQLGNPYFTVDLSGGWKRDFELIATGSGRRVRVRVTTDPM